ncbi:MAG: CDP-diacylglycerol--glycerol-3-phosphate 3-phosphatidyltransferase [Deltaproteobacteria bacterium]
MNLANRLTLLRIVLTFILMGLLFTDGAPSKAAALLLFLLCCLTDYLDGAIARRRGLVSDFGKIMDPVADKILVLGVFLAFVELRLVASWMVALIMVREFLITGLRLFAMRRGRVLAAEAAGKHKTVSQMTTICLILLFIFLRAVGREASFWTPGHEALFVRTIAVCMDITVVLTLISGFLFVWRNRRLIRSL